MNKINKHLVNTALSEIKDRITNKTLFVPKLGLKTKYNENDYDKLFFAKDTKEIILDGEVYGGSNDIKTEPNYILNTQPLEMHRWIDNNKSDGKLYYNFGDNLTFYTSYDNIPSKWILFTNENKNPEFHFGYSFKVTSINGVFIIDEGFTGPNTYKDGDIEMYIDGKLIPVTIQKLEEGEQTIDLKTFIIDESNYNKQILIYLKNGAKLLFKGGANISEMYMFNCNTKLTNNIEFEKEIILEPTNTYYGQLNHISNILNTLNLMVIEITDEQTLIEIQSKYPNQKFKLGKNIILSNLIMGENNPNIISVIQV